MAGERHLPERIRILKSLAEIASFRKINFMRKIELCLLLLVLVLSAEAQVTADFAPGGNAKDGTIIFYGSDNFNNRIAYEKIRGIPYWMNEYQPAHLYAPLNRRYANIIWVRVNLATNEVEFLTRDEQVLAAYPESVSRVVVVDRADSNRILTVFRNDISELNIAYPKTIKHYVQELNQGPVKLLKVYNRQLKQADSLVIYKRFYFVDQPDYFVQVNNRVSKLRRLDKDEIMQLIPQSPELDAYIRENKINFKKEKDLLKLFDFYNQKS